jgi:hypothetical protein
MDENGEWSRLHNEELHNLYISPKMVRVIKSRRWRWTGHVARMEEGKSAFNILIGTVYIQERDLHEGVGGDGRTMLEWILKK